MPPFTPFGSTRLSSLFLSRLGRPVQSLPRQPQLWHAIGRPLSRISVRMLSHQSVSDGTKPTLRESLHQGRTPDFMRRWHQTTVPLPEDWSCDWPSWSYAHPLFDPDSSESQRSLNFIARALDVPVASIEPLAYDVASWDPRFVGATAGRYFYFDGDGLELRAYEGSFAGHDDFLARHVNDPDWPTYGAGEVLTSPDEDNGQEGM
ncbi:hypothetical protein C8R46DRAFT_1071693 [Mycena filopes]|nr:hypothetical protein C8R46DRAFT_1071693 [Mycena filopes]